MAKVGLFGSFNPIHIGHIILANHMTEAMIWMKFGWCHPQSPFKQKSMLANHHRYALVDRAIENYPKLKISTIEFDLQLLTIPVTLLFTLKNTHSTAASSWAKTIWFRFTNGKIIRFY